MSAELFCWNMLNYSEDLLQKDSIDRQGEGLLEFDLPGSRFAELRIGDVSSPVYLSPGNELLIRHTNSETSPAIHFSGKGAVPNVYLAGVSAIVNQFYGRHPEFWRTSPNFVSLIIDTLEQNLGDFHHHFCDTSGMEPHVQDLMATRNGLILTDLLLQFYEINHLAFADQDTLPDCLIQIASSIPFDRRWSEWGCIEYARVLDLYLRSHLGAPILKGKKGQDRDSLLQLLPRIVHDRILSLHSNPTIQELLCAKNLDYWLAMQGITPASTSIYEAIQERFPSSPFLQGLKEHYADWHRISRGQVAPDIIGTNLQGDTLHLTELKGHVVYIDIWASWCRPCIAEFPAYQDLQDALKEFQDLQYLFVSIDKDSQAWKQAVSAHGNMEGLHIQELVDLGEASIYEAYKLWGIPRYMLIDRMGNIIDNNAPSPSSAELEMMIREIL